MPAIFKRIGCRWHRVRRSYLAGWSGLRCLLFLWALGFLGVVVLYPLGQLFVYLLQGWSDLATEDVLFFAERLGASVALGLLSASACVLLGAPLAWCFWVLPQPWTKAMLLSLVLPFMVPPVVAALAVLALFGPQAWLYIGQGEGLGLLLLGNIFYNLGLVTWFCYTAFQRIPASTLEAARSLGLSGYALCVRVFWPLLRSTLATAWLLVFLLCTNSFGLPLLLGGSNWATLEVMIYRVTLYEMNLGLGAWLALVQLLLSVLLVFCYGHWDAGHPVDQGGRKPQWALQWWGQVLAWLYTFMASFLVLGPLAGLLFKSLEHGFGSFVRVVQHPDFLLALGNTLRFAAWSLPVALLLAIGIAAWEWQMRRWPHSGYVLRFLAYLPYLVSAAALSLALLLAYTEWVANLSMLLAAYALMAYSFITRNLSLALQQSRMQGMEAAYSLGATPWRAFRHGLWPQLVLAIQSGVAFALVTMLGEFAVTLFLQRPEWLTLSTLIYEWMGRPGLSNMEQARAAAVLLLFLALGLFALVFAWPRSNASK